MIYYFFEINLVTFITLKLINNILTEKFVKKKTEKGSDSEAFEDSDDGDNEGREMDYISDSSDSDAEVTIEKQLQGVSDEKGLRLVPQQFFLVTFLTAKISPN